MERRFLTHQCSTTVVREESSVFCAVCFESQGTLQALFLFLFSKQLRLTNDRFLEVWRPIQKTNVNKSLQCSWHNLSAGVCKVHRAKTSLGARRSDQKMDVESGLESSSAEMA